jgi:hypothetical protein
MAVAALLPVARQMVEQPERSQVARAARPVAPVAMPMAAAAQVERVALAARVAPPTWMVESIAPVTPATRAANNFLPSG